jgi:hypothetical protein
MPVNASETWTTKATGIPLEEITLRFEGPSPKMKECPVWVISGHSSAPTHVRFTPNSEHEMPICDL